MNRFMLKAGVCLGLLMALTWLPDMAAARTYRFGAWRVEVKHDRFADLYRCRVYGRAKRYSPDGIVSLEFQHNIDTDNAWYRVDGAAPVRLDTLRSRVENLSPFPDPGPLENPSNGEARFPLDVLHGARYVDVRATSPWVKHFRVDGLSAALTYAGDRHCVYEQDRNWRSHRP
ncbi:MAG: hypothetical protein JF615_00945 [Asticcacaulis sp.]|nr:hypothetical protein [Asticcacaulis sp.]